MYYDSMIAKLITHGTTRDQAIGKMRDALNAFVIRGVSSNIAFQSALMQHPRFLSGAFNTGFIAEEYPQGFAGDSADPSDALLLAAVAAFMRRRYINRAVHTSGQLRGHERKVGTQWTVLMGEQRFSLALTSIEGGYAVRHEDCTHELRSDWRLGQLLFHGSWNGAPVCLQVERLGLKYRVIHGGRQADLLVMSNRSAELLALMPKKTKADLSKFLLSPMPGLLTHMPLRVGQEIKAGEKLAVIEAMKMENILKADQDCIVAEILAQQGDSLSVDQPILRFA